MFRQLLIFSMAEFIDPEPGPSEKTVRRDCKYNPEWKCFGMSAHKKGPITVAVKIKFPQQSGKVI